MIRIALACGLLLAAFAVGAPDRAEACSISPTRHPLDSAARCRQHQDAIRRAVAVAEVEIGDFDTAEDPANPGVETGKAPLKIVKVLSGRLKRGDYAYEVVDEPPDGVSCGFSNTPNRGRQLAFFSVDRPSLEPGDVKLVSQQAFDLEASFCRPV